MIKGIILTGALMALLTGPAAGQIVLDDVRDRGLVEAEDPSRVTPNLTRADVLASIMSDNPAAVTANNLLDHFSFLSNAGCDNRSRYDQGLIGAREALTRAREAGVRVREVSVMGRVRVSSLSDGFMIDPSIIARDGGLIPDRGRCVDHQSDVVGPITLNNFHLPPFLVDRSLFSDLDLLLTRRGGRDQVCMQVVGTLSSRPRLRSGRAVPGEYETSLTPNRARLGVACDFEYDNPNSITNRRVRSRALEGYVATAVLEGDAWVWGRETLTIMPDGFVSAVFEPTGSE
ncbi:hypothetical protein [Roseinatronobacter sp. NSM]|uniref:hypothetical protein n=1 Tax=Roseinatronobacter sp. NSM TaxID=3457785 RepID=UPI004036B2D5